MSAELSRIVGQAFFGSFKDLRPIQKAAIPPIVEGHDVLVRSATASGKTEAAIAPLVDRLLPTIRGATGVTIVVASPTRALVNDLYRRLEEPLARLGVRVGIRHGERDHLALIDKPHVLLTTPESLDGLVGRRDPALRAVKAVVLDEAHLLFNTQRGLQVGITLHRLEMWLGTELQTVGLSATIGSAAEVWSFFRPGRSVVDVAVPGGRPLEYRIQLDVSVTDLVDVVKSFADKKLLVFVNSRKECEAITDRLRSFGNDPTRVFAHHSSLANDLRLHVEETFSEITSGVCVATPTLELGIDIGSIDLVILYGVPANWQSLAQRVGRGNRRTEYIEALMCVPESPARSTTLVERLTFQALLAEAFQEHSCAVAAQELFGAYAQQLCSELDAQGQFVGVNKLAAIGAPWPHLDRATTVDVLDTLVDAGIIQKHPAYNRYGPDEGLHEMHDRWQVWSNFSGSGQNIDVRTNQGHVGQVGTRNLPTLHPGDVFLLGGRRWRIERINPRAITVASTTVNPTREVEQGGSRMTPSQTSAEWIRRVICDGIESACVYPRAEGARLAELVGPLRQALKSGWTPVVRHGDKYQYITFAGPLINGALAARFGLPKLSNAVVLTTEHEVDLTNVPSSVTELMPGTLTSPSERSQFQNLLPDEILEAEDRSIIASDPTLAEILHRLRTSPVVELESAHILWS
jgi:ATP-dependent helicase Lhr and Lhr-like helicase